MPPRSAPTRPGRPKGRLMRAGPWEEFQRRFIPATRRRPRRWSPTSLASARVAVLRPGLIFKREAASEIGRYFAGPFLPGAMLRPGLLPLIPGVSGLRFQAVHTDD